MFLVISNQVISLANCALLKLDNFGGPFFFSLVNLPFFVVYYYFFGKTNVLTPFSGLFNPLLCIRPEIIKHFEFSGKIFFSFFFFSELSGKVLRAVFGVFVSKVTI